MLSENLFVSIYSDCSFNKKLCNNECIISSILYEKLFYDNNESNCNITTSKYLSFTSDIGTNIICLIQISDDESIDSHDAIVNTIAINTLKVDLGSLVSVKVVIKESITWKYASLSLELEYQFGISSRHWNELVHTSSPATRTFTTTIGLQNSILSEIIPSLLSGYIIKANIFVYIKLLDTYCIFKCKSVILNGKESNDPFIFNPCCDSIVNLSNIQSKSSNSINNMISNHFIDFAKISSFETPVNEILTISKGLLSYDNWLGPKTCLILGSEGSGKSTILKYIESISIMNNSFDYIIKFSPHSSFDINIDDISNSITLHDKITNIAMLFNGLIHSTKESHHDSSYLILIDNIDSIFNYFSNDINDSIELTTKSFQQGCDSLKSLNISHNKVFILATSEYEITQIPIIGQNALHFDHYINMKAPTLEDRQKLIEFYCEKSKICDTIDTSLVSNWASNLAMLTRGYRPLDIRLLIDRVFSIFHAIDNKMNWNILLQALTETSPKQLEKLNNFISNRSQDTNIKKLRWDDFCGYDDIKNQLKRILKLLCDSLDGLESKFMSKVIGPRGILLYGESGVGKTYLGSIIATEANMNFISIRSTEILSQYFGDTENRIRKIFHYARNMSPCVLFLDEFDALASKRNEHDEGNSFNSRVLSTFLNELDGITRSPQFDILMIIACKNKDDLDEALIRSGRIQYHIHLKLPTLEDLKAVLSYKLVHQSNRSNHNNRFAIPCDDDVDTNKLAEFIITMMDNPTISIVNTICNRAVSEAIGSIIKKNQENPIDYELYDEYKVSWSHFCLAMDEVFNLQGNKS